MTRKHIIITLVFCFSGINIGFSQDKGIKIGVEPIYNYMILGERNQSLISYDGHMFGIGIFADKSLFKNIDGFGVSAGFYYFLQHSKSTDVYYFTPPPCEVGGEPINYQFTINGTGNVHSFRVPIKARYNFGSFTFSGGINIDYELKNNSKVELSTIPEYNCMPEPINGNEPSSKFRFGVGFDIGYKIDSLGKVSLAPNISYNLVFNRDQNYYSPSKINYHGLGVGCKVFF